jgi:hypothetical protein
MARDSKRAACYRAEHASLACLKDVRLSVREARELQRNAACYLARTTEKRLYLPDFALFDRPKGNVIGWYLPCKNLCSYNEADLSYRIVLHETAHWFANAHGEDGHGPIWRATYVLLVRAYMGEEEAQSLESNFEAQLARRPRRSFRLMVDVAGYDRAASWKPVEDKELERRIRKAYGRDLRDGCVVTDWRATEYRFMYEEKTTAKQNKGV